MKAVGLAMSKVDVRTMMPFWLRPFNHGAGRGLGQVGYVGFALSACLALGLLLSAAASAQAPGPPGANPDNRAYELVSPAYKESGIGLGVWGQFTTGENLFALEKERFAAGSNLGATLLDSPFAYANDWAMAERVGDIAGWQSHPAISHPSVGSAAYRFLQPALGAANDLSLIGWVTNAGFLRPFPEMHDWRTDDISNPGFLGDWQGRWEIFGPTDLDQLQGPGDANLDGGGGVSKASAFAAGGEHMVASSGIRGLAGPGDPSTEMVERGGGSGTGARSTYLDDVSAGLSNTFPGEGIRTLIHVCSGGTGLPVRVEQEGEFLLSERACADGELVSEYGATIQMQPNSGISPQNVVDRIISRDGSRVFFMSPDPVDPDGFSGPLPAPPNTGCTGAGEDSLCATQLFVYQENEDGSVAVSWISRPEEALLGQQEASLAGRAIFEGASEDGSRVFFRSNAPLTADDPNAGCGAPCLTGSPSNQSWDLYMAELSSGTDPTGPGYSLTRISGGPDGASDCNSPVGGAGRVGALRFVSVDARTAYFTCAAPLAGVPNPTNGTITEPDGTQTTTNATNLYMFSDADGSPEWRFIARLPRSTSVNNGATCGTTAVIDGSPLGANNGGPDGTAISLVGSPSAPGRCAHGTDDGEFFTIWTPGQLTADDPDSESMDIYAYDAASDQLTRITAPQGGPGASYPCGNDGPAASVECHGDTGFSLYRMLPGVATAPAVPGDRIAFFQSASRLVPEHTDDSYQVYQWKNGELSLLSPGFESSTVPPRGGHFYAGNEASGRNVYFVTRDRLTWQDTDAVLDVYTARIGGGIPEPASPALCEVLNGGCKDARKKAPDADDPSSAAFSGEGNFIPDQGGALNPRRCVKLARLARVNLQKAKRFKRLAQRSSRRGAASRARVLNRRAKSSARSARRAIVQTKRCRAQVRRARSSSDVAGGAR